MNVGLEILLREMTQPRSLVEILVLTVLFFIVLSFIRGTRGAAILKGMIFIFVAVFVGVMFLADQLQLTHLKQLLTWLLSISFMALIVIFAPEMRRGLSRLAQSNVLSQASRALEENVIREIVDACFELAHRRIGALITIEREASLDDIIEDYGVTQDAAVTSRLLQTIFFTGSPLHDGSVIIRSGRIVAAGCQLPMPDNPRIPRDLGMRHRAAIGITEETDAVAIVVSEETGKVSMFIQGRIMLGLQDRKQLYDHLVDVLKPETDSSPWWATFLRVTRRLKRKPSAQNGPVPDTERSRKPEEQEQKQS